MNELFSNDSPNFITRTSNWCRRWTTFAISNLTITLFRCSLIRVLGFWSKYFCYCPIRLLLAETFQWSSFLDSNLFDIAWWNDCTKHCGTEYNRNREHYAISPRSDILQMRVKQLLLCLTFFSPNIRNFGQCTALV